MSTKVATMCKCLLTVGKNSSWHRYNWHSSCFGCMYVSVCMNFPCNVCALNYSIYLLTDALVASLCKIDTISVYVGAYIWTYMYIYMCSSQKGNRWYVCAESIMNEICPPSIYNANAAQIYTQIVWNIHTHIQHYASECQLSSQTKVNAHLHVLHAHKHMYICKQI